MWWCERSTQGRARPGAGGAPNPARRGLLLATLALAACGFAPVHGPGGFARGAFAIAAPETPMGYALLSRLEARLGTPRAPRYVLSVTLDVDETTSVVTEDQATQRYSLAGIAEWSLQEAGTQIAAGQVDSFTSFSASGTTVATEAARADAQQRLADGLADRIVTRLHMATP